MSSAPTAPSRPERGRVLLVGASGALDDVAAQLVRPAVRVGNLFEAIGAMTTAPTHDPLTAVVIDTEVARRVGGSGVAAVRRIDPAARLVIVGAADAPLEPDAAGLFDAHLTTPVCAAALAAAVEQETRTAAPAAETPPPRPAPSVAAKPPPSVTSRPAPPAAAIEAVDRLGDVDLVEAALHDPDGVLATALQLIGQETGWSDVTLTPPGPAEAAVTGAAVRYGEQDFGHLTGHGADPEALRLWAAWLARWLALDRSFRDHRVLAYRDDLTGAWNRRFFNMFLEQSIERAARERCPVTVMVFDLDDFKQYNDRFGHEAGDIILVETVRLLNSVIRRGDRVCRIGGDEFAVIFADPEGPREAGSTHPERVEQLAKRFQDQVGTMDFPKLGIDAPGTLSISGGLASYPWDGTDSETLLRHADQLALHSKRLGKNVITFGPEAGQSRRPGD